MGHIGVLGVLDLDGGAALRRYSSVDRQRLGESGGSVVENRPADTAVVGGQRSREARHHYAI